MLRTTNLALLASSLLTLGGCAVQGPGPNAADCDPDLPGDVDCNPDGAGGKSDAWDRTNDPRNAGHNLNYRWDELPLEGRSEANPWAASYWPTTRGSTNYRWQGESTLSPLEKYDAAFAGWTVPEEFASHVPSDCGEQAHEEYGRYRNSLGPAARWMAGAQGRDRMYDGRDSDGDGEVDECSDREGIAGWWGLCHAWSPAAILEPEPQHAVEYNGVRFEVSDIKAMLITIYDDTESTGVGGRCNNETVDHDDTGRVTADECRDTNAGAFHVVITNLIGLNRQAFVEDRVGGFQVWNQPLFGYHITEQNEITLEQANQLLGVTGDTYTYNDKAVKFVEVRLTTDYLTEGSQSTSPLGTDGYTSHDSYHYILEIAANGKIVGGEWVGSSRDAHPDFLWIPTGPRTGWYTRANPNISLEKVHMLLNLSRQDEEPTPPPAGDHSYETSPDLAIPDNDSTGVTTTIDVPDDFTIGSTSVSVDIEHTYRGDLVVEVEHNGQRVTLSDREGGSQDNIQQTWTLSDFTGSASGTWTLHVVDTASADTGTIKKFSLGFTSAG